MAPTTILHISLTQVVGLWERINKLIVLRVSSILSQTNYNQINEATLVDFVNARVLITAHMSCVPHLLGGSGPRTCISS